MLFRMPARSSLLTKELQQLTVAAQEVTVKTDIQEYIEASKTGVTPPAPIQYVPYESDNPNFGAVSGGGSSNTATVTGVGTAPAPSPTPVTTNASPSRAAVVTDAPKVSFLFSIVVARLWPSSTSPGLFC